MSLLRAHGGRWGAGIVAVAMLLAACSSGSVASSTTGATASSGSRDANLERALAAITPYTGKPSEFPVKVPLAKKLASASKIVYMDCGTPTCALYKAGFGPAAQALGANLITIKAGINASAINSAFQSAIQLHPAALIVAGIDPIEWTQPLAQLKAANVPIVGLGIVDGEQYGLTTPPNAVLAGADVQGLSGKLMADWVYVHIGAHANVEFNWVPELPLSKLQLDAFVKEFTSLCPSCTLRSIKIPASTLGSTAQNLIVSDLQAHPSTNVVVGSSDEQLLGLPSALRAAGLKNITTVAQGGSPSNLEYVKNGQQTVDLSLSFPVLLWTVVDVAAKAATNQSVDPAELGLPPAQFLVQSDITFDPNKGWNPYPDYTSKFAVLWHAAK